MLSIYNYCNPHQTTLEKPRDTKKILCYGAIDFICITLFVAGVLLAIAGILHLSLANPQDFIGTILNLIPGGKIGSGLIIGSGATLYFLSIAVPLAILFFNRPRPAKQPETTIPHPPESNIQGSAPPQSPTPSSNIWGPISNRNAGETASGAPMNPPYHPPSSSSPSSATTSSESEEATSTKSIETTHRAPINSPSSSSPSRAATFEENEETASISTKSVEIMHNSPITVIKGKVTIHNPRLTGAIGKYPDNLPEKTRDILINGTDDWKRTENEMMIKCEISELDNPKSPLRNRATFHIPLSLFYKDSNYSSLKEEGDTISFTYKEYEYTLTLDAQSFPSLQKAIEECNYCYKSNNGATICLRTNDTPYDDTAYRSCLDKKASELPYFTKEKAEEIFKKNFPDVQIDFNKPSMFPYRAYINHEGSLILVCDITVFKEEIQVFISDACIAIYAKTTQPLEWDLWESPDAGGVVTSVENIGGSGYVPIHDEFLIVIPNNLKVNRLDNIAGNVGRFTITLIPENADSQV